jgi:hypothetical protein
MTEREQVEKEAREFNFYVRKWDEQMVFAFALDQRRKQREEKAPPIALVTQDKLLTVIMLKPKDFQQADLDLAAVETGENQIFRIVSELYLHRLRLRVAQNPALVEKISFSYIDENGKRHPIGLQFEEELKWPVGFCQEAWDNEIAIQEAHTGAIRGKD